MALKVILKNKGLTLTAEVLCVAILTGRGGTEGRDKGGEDDTTVCRALFLTQ